MQLNNSITPLPVGTRAPAFRLPSTIGGTLSLQGLAGGAVVLAFFPTVSEPVSREQLTLYQAYSETFESLQACVLGISTDEIQSLADFAHITGTQFPLLADVQARGLVARQYGVFRESQGMCARSIFVIDAQSIIRFSHAYPDQLNPGVDQLLTTLETIARLSDR